MKTQATQNHVDAIGSQSGNISTARWFAPVRAVNSTAIATAILSLAFLVSPGKAPAQQALLSASPNEQAAGQRLSNATLPVFLASSIDSKKLKEGQEVDGKMAATLRLKDGTVISRGMKVVGHVTESKARSNGDAQSSLAIVFDKIDLSGGKEVAFTAVIQAVAPPLNTGPSPWAGVDYSSMDQALAKPANPQVESNTVPMLNGQSEGVLGIKNLQLSSNGVLNSDQKSIKLDSGTQVMIHGKIAG